MREDQAIAPLAMRDRHLAGLLSALGFLALLTGKDLSVRIILFLTIHTDCHSLLQHQRTVSHPSHPPLAVRTLMGRPLCRPYMMPRV